MVVQLIANALTDAVPTSKEGIYSVKEGNRRMKLLIYGPGGWKLIWRTKLPPSRWNMFLSVFGFSWARPQSIKEADESWELLESQESHQEHLANDPKLYFLVCVDRNE
ncbi:hypothetical protein H5410_057931 [Solanum commersonii]|uniref:Uncharacterized protein n=1 Tax=Solanum commersonii TaxID=4109 RepID=A0A9J5WR64_SOLCO|nr:hypothetical protein H5410_057931 [Solanum commersonii]